MAKRAAPGWGEGHEEPPRKRAAPPVGGPGSRFSGRPSLDSDEEEEEEEAEGCGSHRLPPGLEGQEPGPAWGGEGEGPFTPFNLEEELAEGGFDPQGHFLPAGGAPARDPWLEAIDWRQVTSRPAPPPAPSPTSPPPSPPPLPQLLRGVLELLHPGETVGGALRRLGGEGRRGGGGRGRGGRAAPPPELEALVELSDGLVARGVLGVLGETRERLGERLRALGEGQGGGETPPGSPPLPQPGGSSHDTAPPRVDMFAEEEEEEEEGEREEVGEVQWEYRWEHGGDPNLYGPFSSAQMQAWAAQGYFQGGARCRRVKPQGPFYDCSRVDFQLYT